MRVLLSKISRKDLFEFLKIKNNAKSILDLSKKINIPKSTLGEWLYNLKRYTPFKLIPPEIRTQMEILDSKKDNWGSIEGGKKAYQIIVRKYGIKEIKKRQSNGGRRSILKI